MPTRDCEGSHCRRRRRLRVEARRWSGTVDRNTGSHRRGHLLSPQVAAQIGGLPVSDKPLAKLTPRQRQVLQLIAKGYRMREIATPCRCLRGPSRRTSTRSCASSASRTQRTSFATPPGWDWSTPDCCGSCADSRASQEWEGNGSDATDRTTACRCSCPDAAPVCEPAVDQRRSDPVICRYGLDLSTRPFATPRNFQELRQ